ncbi:MAG: mechanosensitive ion channel domain-containing protein [Rikenellaceae bacterium]
MFLDSTTTAVETTTDVTSMATEMVDFLGGMSTTQLIQWITEITISIGSKLLLALLIYLVGAWVIGRIVGVMQSVFNKRSVDVSLGSFLISLVRIVLMIILVFTIVGVLGINTSSFLALFASAGLAVGMALSGTLQNFAGGVLILFLRPFQVGDFIEAQGFSGTVKEISLFSTILNTLDNKTIIIPNGSLSNNSVNNYSKESTRCVSWVFGVAYGTDISKATDILNELLDNNEFVLQDNARVIELTALSSSSVDIVVKAWCQSANYWALYHSMNRRVYDTFNAKGVEFPFSQLDVNIKGNK